MGNALIGGLIRSSWAAPDELAVVEPLASARADLVRRFPGVVVTETGVTAESSVLAVKPADAQAGCRTIAGSRCPLVLSIVAGVTIGQLETWLGRGVVVLRAMPNTPGLLGAGASALAGGLPSPRGTSPGRKVSCPRSESSHDFPSTSSTR